MAITHSINVIGIMDGGSLVNIKSFTNDEAGGKEADEYFSRTVLNEAEQDGNPLTDDQLVDVLVEGRYESSNWLFIITNS